MPRPADLSPPSAPARIGSLEIFWPLVEPILAALGPRQVCEVGVAGGAFTARLLAWGAENDCGYVGVDPAPDEAVRGWFAPGPTVPAASRELRLETSLAALPELGRCDAYFLDGDHNYHTVRAELTAVAQTDLTARGPLVFVHDVGWPWGRRDLYYLPTTVPAEARQPWSETLGVSLEDPEGALVDGGLREPGRYAIAHRAGGPRNGVLTAVEDFLADDVTGAGWEAVILPVAYGLAVLHRPATTPAACRERLRELREFAAVGGPFLRECEANYLQLYFHGEHAGHALRREGVAHHATLTAYADLERAYADLLTHSQALEAEYGRLREAFDRASRGMTNV